jgi:hypothetical protein
MPLFDFLARFFGSKNASTSQGPGTAVAEPLEQEPGEETKILNAMVEEARKCQSKMKRVREALNDDMARNGEKHVDGT